MAPISDDNALVKVTRICGAVYTTQHICPVHFAPLVDNNDVKRYVRLPSILWNAVRSKHRQFPDNFKRAVSTIFFGQAYPTSTGYTFYLPSQLWGLVFSFASRDWFNPIRSEVESLRDEVLAERHLRTVAENRLIEVEAAKATAERERDMYRVSFLPNMFRWLDAV